jgi:hypothetical protein
MPLQSTPDFILRADFLSSKQAFIQFLFTLSLVPAFAQLTNSSFELQQRMQLSSLPVALPFLLIAPDARSSAMGESGTADCDPSAAIHWNSAIMCHAESGSDISASYSPVYRGASLSGHLGFVSGIRRLAGRGVIGAAVRYLHLGPQSLGLTIPTSSNREYSIEGAYAYDLPCNWSLGVVARAVNSSLAGPQGIHQNKFSGASDFGAFRSSQLWIGEMLIQWKTGINIANIGSRRDYWTTMHLDYMPCNLRLGNAVIVSDGYNHRVSLSADFSKLLVPTPPVYLREDGEYVTDQSGSYIVTLGRKPGKGIQSMVGSFSDAPGIPMVNTDGEIIGAEPGSVFREELNEVLISIGSEYVLFDKYAIRCGYVHQPESKSNLRHFTMGGGIRHRVYRLDVSYQHSTTANNPLGKTVRISFFWRIRSVLE